MASLVLGAAGAVVGSFFGMPGLGFMIGSALGSALEPKKGQDGPRLTDLHNQNSQYGLMIPIAWGTVRIAGNVIWLPDKVEHTHHNSGKGGSGPASYTYTQSMGIQICEGPIVGIRRIWANKRLVWQDGASNDGDFPFTLYTGTTTQLPHPAYEADKGVGNVPAHRGKALFFVDDMALDPFGNTPPSFEFEVIRTASARIQRVNQWTPPTGGGQGYLNGIGFDGQNFHIATYTSGPTPIAYTRTLYAYDGSSSALEVSTTIDTPAPTLDGTLSPVQVQNSYAAAIYVANAANLYKEFFWAYDGALTAGPLSFPRPVFSSSFGIGGCPFYFNGAIYATGGDLDCYVAKWDAPSGVPNGSILAYYVLKASPSAALVLDADLTVDSNGDVWVFASEGGGGSPEIWHLDSDLNLIQNWPKHTTSLAYTTGFGEPTVYNGYLVSNDGAGNQSLSQASGGFTVIDTDTSAVFLSGMVSMGGGYYLTSDGVFKILAPPTLQSVVDDLSVRAGYVVGQYQTDDLTQLVNGYVIAQQADCRSCLEPLLTWYFTDAVESGPAIKYVIRGAAPDENIPDDDLAAYVEGEDVPALIENTRMQEVDLPRRITVSYFDIDADYQIGSQHEKRETTNSTTEQSIAFAIVASAAEGKQTAGIMLYDTWSKRRKISFSTPRKWSKLEPTDVKTAGGYTFVITKRDEGQAGVLKFDAVATRKQIFGAAAVGAPSIGFTPPVPPTTQLTQMVMLDIPLVDDGDYPNGHYVAMAGAASSSWPGAELYKSIDGGTSYTSLLVNSVPDIIGTCSTTLGDFLGGNVFDNVNSVTVVVGLGGGTLASASELAVLNGTNRALIGEEMIQFKNATLTAPSTYVLSGLLRGRRGTDWAMPAHGPSERFVMLPVSVNVNAPFAELGLSRKYKAVTVGQALASATAQDFTNTGIALKPYAPVHIGGGRNAAGDITLHWQRRTRIGGAWLDYVDAQLGETSETYVVTIYSVGYAAIIRQVFVGIESLDYLASDQTADFGSPQSTLYWGVAQSGAYDPGNETRGTT